MTSGSFRCGVSGPLAAPLRNSRIRVESLGMLPGVMNMTSLVHLARTLRAERPDLVHTWMYHANVFGGLAARLAGRWPLIWAIHHTLETGGRDLKSATLRVAGLGRLLSGVMPDRIVCCGRSALELHGRAGFACRKMMVIHNGVDLQVFRPDVVAGRRFRRELALPSTAPIVGMFARYHPVKDHLTFLGAAARLHREIPQARFVLAGRDIEPANAELSGLVSSHGLSDVVHLMGVRSDMPSALNAASLVTLSSRSEAFPTVLCQAMACAVPCVATNVGDNSDILADAGIAVPAGDPAALAEAWLRVLRMPDSDRRADGAAGPPARRGRIRYRRYLAPLSRTLRAAQPPC